MVFGVALRFLGRVRAKLTPDGSEDWAGRWRCGGAAEPPWGRLLLPIQGKDRSRAVRVTEGGVQGRWEDSCVSPLPGFRCKGKHLGNQGQPGHFPAWK